MSLTTKSHGELFQRCICGHIASMFLRRGVEPTTDEWSVIYADEDLTILQIAEIANSLGYSFVFDTIDTGATGRCPGYENVGARQ